MWSTSPVTRRGSGRDVTLVRIEGGKHDLTLSPAPARERLFAELDGWLAAKLGVDYRENLALAPVRPSQDGLDGGVIPRAG